MRYSMYDEIGRGDSGQMCEAIWLDENEEIQFEKDARPRLGVSLKVGSAYARTMQHQDWWMCTPIQEILEESENKVVFRTRTGSIYTWKRF